MDASTREELRRQHLRIFASVDKARVIARDAPHKLHDVLLDLGNLLRWHQLREEQALRDLVPSHADWDLIHTLHSHADEHHDLYETLLALSTTDDPKSVADKAIDLFDRIVAHMRAETFVM